MPETRPLLLADAPAAVTLIRTAFSHQSAQTDPPSAALRETAETIASAIIQGGGACVDEQDALIGVVLWAEKAGGLYFGRLAVHPHYRRRGIARRLIAAAEAEASRLGLPRIHMSTRLVLADNRTLFTSCGYIEGERATHDGYSAPTSIAMQKTLCR